MNENWFKKDYKYYKYSEIIYTDSLYEVLAYFYATNNIAESLHNKISLYLPNKKITNNNFLIAIRNILINNEIKKRSVARKDVVTRTLIEISKNIKKK